MPDFGRKFRLTLLTDDPVIAARADQAGVDRVGLDLEVLGKAERQAGEDTRLSRHSIAALAAVGGVLRNAALFVRLNPVNPDTRHEVEAVLEAGAKVLMLPFFKTPEETEAFVRMVDRRASVMILVETAPALVRIREILAVPGLDEVMAGLNDLRLQLGVRSHFEILASPLLEMFGAEAGRAKLPFSVGGVGRFDDATLPIPPDLVLAQYPRLGATGAWISRSFLNGLPPDAELGAAVTALRARLTVWAVAPRDALERAQAELAHRARTGFEPSPSGSEKAL